MAFPRLQPRLRQRLGWMAVLVGVSVLGLGGCAGRAETQTGNPGGHTPGMTDYDSRLVFLDSPSYLTYDLR